MADDTTSMSDDSQTAPSSPGAVDGDQSAPDSPIMVEGAGTQTEGAPEYRVDDSYDATADPPPDPHEGAVPPGYDWPTHGGYLGCLLGLVAACTLSGFLGGTWFAILAAPSWVKLTITLGIALVAFVGFGRLGWVLGKRYYREYAQLARGRTGASPLPETTPGEGDSSRG